MARNQNQGNQQQQGGGATASGMDDFLHKVGSLLEGEITKDAVRAGFQPTLRRKAELTAKWLRKLFPNALGGNLAESIIDFLGSRIIALAGSKTWAGVTGTELGEFVKLVNTELRKKDDGELAGKKIPEHLVAVFAKMDEALGQYVTGTFNKTLPADVPDMTDILKNRAAGEREVKEMMAHGPKKPEKPEVPLNVQVRKAVQTVDKVAAEFVTQVGPHVAQLKIVANAAKRKSERENRVRGPRGNNWLKKACDIPYWFNWLLDLPWKAFGLLWK